MRSRAPSLSHGIRLTRLFIDFVRSKQAGGILLIFCTLISLILCNSGLQEHYLNAWHFSIAGMHAVDLINDGLMTIFFLLIGLELEREIYAGELSQVKNAILPAIAALGGMLVPAGLFFAFNFGTATQTGSGIPMATDIAFALGILSLLGNRVPPSLRILLTALAVIDDLGAILVIAVFYTGTLSWTNLGIALAIFGFLLVLNRLRVHNLIPYLIGGMAMWYFMQHSGVHATITGVMLAFAIPFGNGDEKSPSFILQNFLHKPVAFIILPLFALANTGIVLNADWHLLFGEPLGAGILAGLTIGKPVGIFLFTFSAVALGFCSLPADLRWSHIAGAGLLGGIGFTMSIFITLLAFDSPGLINQSKLAILIASSTSAILGFVWLRTALKKPASAIPV